jgi:tRNA-specific adenosine deaminase 3
MMMIIKKKKKIVILGANKHIHHKFVSLPSSPVFLSLDRTHHRCSHEHKTVRLVDRSKVQITAMEATKKSLEPILNATTSNDNVIVFRNDPDCSIVEILSPRDVGSENDSVRTIEAFCVHVEPRACSRVVKQLSSTLPLEECLSHLKRVRRRPLSPPKSTEATSKSPSHITDPKNPSQNYIASKEKDDDESRPLATGVKRIHDTEGSKKSHKPNFVLEILLGTHSRIRWNNKSSAHDHPIVHEFGPLYSVMVPKYEPRSEQEWKEHNASWPTLYHPLKFEEYRKQQFTLSETELNTMKEVMDICILTESVLIVDPNHEQKSPKTNRIVDSNMSDSEFIDLGIVSSSRIEKRSQDQLSQKQQQQINRLSTSLLDNNPLSTPILLALQGVSRCEREAKTSVDGDTAVDIHSKKPDSDDQHEKQHQKGNLQKKRGQYICTGYDMYSYYEPNIFEAMACLHSRLRRLIYFFPNNRDGGVWGCGLSKHDVHHLSGTNHNYRAFEYRQSPYAP